MFEAKHYISKLYVRNDLIKNGVFYQPFILAVKWNRQIAFDFWIFFANLLKIFLNFFELCKMKME